MGLKGSCLCGEISYEIDSVDMPIVHCHCKTCRKAHAAPFASTAGVKRENFRWLSGINSISTFESSPGKLRHFCKRCGSHLVAERPAQPHVIVRVATLDDDPGLKPEAHIWVSHDVPWLEYDRVCQHSEWRDDIYQINQVRSRPGGRPPDAPVGSPLIFGVISEWKIMLRCKSCNAKLEKAGTVKLNAAPYVGYPFGAFTWTGDSRSQRSLLLLILSVALAAVFQNVVSVFGVLVCLGYHILVVNDPKQLYKCPSCPKIYVGQGLLEFRRDDDLYI